MKAIIIGAGRGIRMMPETENIPKCLMEGINGQRVLDWIQGSLRHGGIDDIVFIGGYRMEQVQERYSQLRFYKNTDWANNNVLESLMFAQDEMNGEFITSYSDILYGSNVVKRLIGCEADIALVVSRGWRSRYADRKLKGEQQAEKVIIQNGRVTQISRNIQADCADGEFIGLAKFSAQAARFMLQRYEELRNNHPDMPFHAAPNLRLAYLSDMLQEFIEAGLQVETVEIGDGWAELDTLEDIEWARARLNGQIDSGGAQEFWAVRAHDYERLDWTSRKGYLDTFVEAGNFRTSDCVLDVGTGTGIVAHAIAPLVLRVVGIDISAEMRKHAASLPSGNVRLEDGDVRHMRFADDSFDKITARMVFHHLLDGAEQAARECFRVLKPGGLMVLSEGVPPDKSLRDWYTSMFALKEARLTFFEEDLVSLLQSGGFTVERVIEHITPQVSIGNWLQNSGLPKRRQDMIMQLHRDLDEAGKRHYNMTITDRDILCDFKFLILVGRKAPPALARRDDR